MGSAVSNLNKSGSKFVAILVMVMVAIIATFLLFEQQSTTWITQVAQQLVDSGAVGLLALFLIAALACDIVLPIPSSIVAVVAATTLGFWGGATVIWVGLMLSCVAGYLIGAGFSLFRQSASSADISKARSLADKVGPGTLVLMRGVPVLAETSVIAAGMVRYPLVPFIVLCALANAGLALAYGYVGSEAGAQDSFLLVVFGSVAVPAGAWLFKGSCQRIFTVVDGQSATVRTSAAIERIDAKFVQPFHYPVLFEHNVFDAGKATLKNVLNPVGQGRQKAFVFIDSGVYKSDPQLSQHIVDYFNAHQDSLELLSLPAIVEGGEAAKQHRHIEHMYQQMLHSQLDRHGWVIAIGGGAVLDAVGFACATFHRGIKLLRMPSTVLAQNDAGVGVKNGFNWANTKNLIGTFAPPNAVINDNALLRTLSSRDKRAGLAEAVKVALIRDKRFFDWLVANRQALRDFAPQATQYAIARCAELHLAQITGAGDPFEQGSARPLDYGHWSAHKLEALTQYDIRHGEAVAIGMVLDARYAVNVGLLAAADCDALVDLLTHVGFELWHYSLASVDTAGRSRLLEGLEEFRQHLGGELCVTLLTGIGQGKEVNHIDQQAMLDALNWLKRFS